MSEETYGFVRRVDEDDFIVLVRAILVHPVGIEHPKIAAPLPDTFFRSGLEGSAILELIHTLVGRLAIDDTYITGAQ